MLSDILKIITHISENDEINTANYIEGVEYINNLYTVLNKVKIAIAKKDMEFRPTFKGKATCEKYGIECEPIDSTMQKFLIISPSLLEDKTREKIFNVLNPICDSIKIDDDKITFILK